MSGKEKKLVNNISYCSTTDENGIISSVTKELAEISGYTQDELIGQNHNILRSQDMPKIIYKIMWETLNKKKIFIGFTKNKTKDGSYYWMEDKVYLFSGGKSEKCNYISHKSPISSRAKEVLSTRFFN